MSGMGNRRRAMTKQSLALVALVAWVVLRAQWARTPRHWSAGPAELAAVLELRVRVRWV